MKEVFSNLIAALIAADDTAFKQAYTKAKTIPTDIEALAIMILAAARAGDNKKFHELLSQGARIDATIDCTGSPFNGYTALHFAAAFNHHVMTTEITTAIVGNQSLYPTTRDADAAINCEDSQGNSAAHLAAQNGHHTTLKSLQSAGASLSLPNKSGRHPIHLAAQNGHEEACKLLCTVPCEHQALDSDGNTPLALAAAHARNKICNLEQFRDTINVRNRRYETPLILLCKSVDENHTEYRDIYNTAKTLLENGANALAQDDDGNNALHFIAKKFGKNSSPDTAGSLFELFKEHDPLTSHQANKNKETPQKLADIFATRSRTSSLVSAAAASATTPSASVRATADTRELAGRVDENATSSERR